MATGFYKITAASFRYLQRTLQNVWQKPEPTWWPHVTHILSWLTSTLFISSTPTRWHGRRAVHRPDDVVRQTRAQTSAFALLRSTPPVAMLRHLRTTQTSAAQWVWVSSGGGGSGLWQTRAQTSAVALLRSTPPVAMLCHLRTTQTSAAEWVWVWEGVKVKKKMQLHLVPWTSNLCGV